MPRYKSIETLVRDFSTDLEMLVFARVASRIQEALGGVAGSAAKTRKNGTATSSVSAPAAKTRRKSAKSSTAWKLQGQYLGALRSLTGRNRALVKSTAKEKGVAAAVKLAFSLK